MPLFTYKAKDKRGEIIEDVTQSANKGEAVIALKKEGLQVLTISSLEKKSTELFSGSISTAEKAAFCRFMATMLRAGLPLSEALDIVRKETQNKRLRKVLIDLSFQTRRGSSLSATLSKYTKDFNVVLLTMIKAGEESWTLDESFDYLSKQLLAAHEMMQKVKGAMAYPAVIIVAMLGNGIVMMAFVLPNLSEVFTSLNLDLPTPTRLILGFGTLVGENTLLFIGVIFLLIFLTFLTFYIQKTRAVVFNLFSRLPVVKSLVNQIDVARFSRTLATLIKSGVPILQALDVSADTLSQPRVRKIAKGFSKKVAKGEALSDILAREKNLFPGVMVQTIRAGEKSGTMETVLLELSEFYESEVDYSLKRLTALLEPILMLIIGVAVGGMVVMMIVPIYSIVGSLEGGL